MARMATAMNISTCFHYGCLVNKVFAHLLTFVFNVSATWCVVVNAAPMRAQRRGWLLPHSKILCSSFAPTPLGLFYSRKHRPGLASTHVSASRAHGSLPTKNGDGVAEGQDSC